MEEAHPEEPHWYLMVIGSDPSVRGEGFGQALMRSGMDRCDGEHAPAYLEASEAALAALLQRFGFEQIGEIDIPDGPKMCRCGGATVSEFHRQQRHAPRYQKRMALYGKIPA